MTVCPFMSRPFWRREEDTDAALVEVACLRERCAAWGPVEPLWRLDRVDGETRERYVVWREGRWQSIPKNPCADLILCGCRRLGYEVPE
jgi:hypothetical protein